MTIKVPNTNTFSLQNVVDAVEGHAGNIAAAEFPNDKKDLKDCFDQAVLSYFDSNYNNDSYAPANSMLRFRNYGPPTGNPTTGTFNIPFNSYGTGIRVNGICVYVSPNGNNLYVIIKVNYSTVIYQLVRFSMSNFDLSTLSYHSERNIGIPSITGNTFKALRFTDNGDRFYILEAYHLPQKVHTARIRTWTLSTNWDITSAEGFYETTPIPKWGGSYHYCFFEMDFTEDRNTLILLSKTINHQNLEYFSLAQQNIIPSGTINAYNNSRYSDIEITPFVMDGFNVYEEYFSPGKTVLGLHWDGIFQLIEVKINEFPIWHSDYPFSILFSVTPFTDYKNSYSTSQLEYTYILEWNGLQNSHLEPRIYLKVM